MAKFAYRVQDKSAQTLEGVLDAPSESVAEKFLTEREYEILSLKQVRESITLRRLQTRFERANPVQFNFFVRQMATLLKAGVPMLPGIQTLQEGVQDSVLKRVLREIYLDIEKGSSFSQAISNHPRVFGPLFVSTIRSGEAIGELDTVLHRVADILEKDYQTTVKIKAALRYPVFALVIMVVAFLVGTLFIIPRFRGLFESMGAELPLPTVILLQTSEVVLGYWYFVTVGVILAVVGVIYHYKSHGGKRFWDGLVLKVWVFGLFMRNAVFSRYSRMLGLMLKSGVNILQGLELIADIVGNAVIGDSILRMREQVTQGDSLSNQMRQEGLYPILLVQIVHVGEESGKIDDLLLQIAEFYDAELEIMTKNMETMIEPFFIVILGVFVAVMALGIFLPMWNIFGVIQQAAAV